MLALVPALILLFVGGLAWNLYVFHISNRDALDLVPKLDIPRPTSARDWPELCIDAVVVDPEVPRRILVLVQWPARPHARSLLVLEPVGAPQRALRLLQQWRDRGVSISPTRVGDRGLLLRRRRSPDQLRTLLHSESCAV
jgi:hypothetical protein